MALTTIVRGRVFNFSHEVGRSQDSEPGFSKANDVKAGKDGVVYVLNRSKEGSSISYYPRVAKVWIGAPLEEEYLLSMGKAGTGDGEFIWPTSLALDKDENVFVSDEHLQRITVFDKDANLLNTWGTPGTGPGELNGPSGLSLDSEDNLYEVDSRSHRVQKFTKDGVFLSEWGHFGSGEGEFNMPWGITVDQHDNVYVADWKNHRIQKFSPDGDFLLQIGRPAPGAGVLEYPKSYPRNNAFSHLYRRDGADRGELNHPSHVAVDSDGDIYVCDWGNDRVQIYTPEGQFIISLYGDARELSKWVLEQHKANPDVPKACRRAKHPEQMWKLKMPTGIDFDPETNRIYIVDHMRRRLQIYVKEKNYLEPEFNL